MKEIFNIFPPRKNRKPKKITRPKIIADYREKQSLVISEIIKQGIDVEFKPLKVADFLVNEIAIERKTVSDFVSSMIDKRIFRQLEEIKQYPKYFLLIEGIEEQELYSDDKEGLNGNAIRGMILSIILKYQVPILFTKDSEDTAKFIGILARKTEKKEVSLNPKKRSLNINEQKQYILEGFPGIGPTTAKKLLKEFKSIKNIINTPFGDLEKSIGKKSDIFRKLFD